MCAGRRVEREPDTGLRTSVHLPLSVLGGALIGGHVVLPRALECTRAWPCPSVIVACILYT